MNREDATEIDDAMSQLREAVERQLGGSSLSTLDVAGAEVQLFASDMPASVDERERERLLGRVRELEPWLQGPFALPGGLVISGAWRNDTRWLGLAEHVPNIDGKRVLDVGSNAGYDPFMFKLRGAAEVMACEPFDFIRQMQFLEEIYRTGITPCRLAWQDLDPATHGAFDLVHCHGVLYHEIHPMALLQRLHSMLKDDGTLLFGSMMLSGAELAEYARFVPGAYYGDPTWWWVPGRLAMRWMLESAGFANVEAFGLSDGPPGEFPTVNGYFSATRGQPAEGLQAP